MNICPPRKYQTSPDRIAYDRSVLKSEVSPYVVEDRYRVRLLPKWVPLESVVERRSRDLPNETRRNRSPSGAASVDTARRSGIVAGVVDIQFHVLAGDKLGDVGMHLNGIELTTRASRPLAEVALLVGEPLAEALGISLDARRWLILTRSPPYWHPRYRR